DPAHDRLYAKILPIFEIQFKSLFKTRLGVRLEMRQDSGIINSAQEGRDVQLLISLCPLQLGDDIAIFAQSASTRVYGRWRSPSNHTEFNAGGGLASAIVTPFRLTDGDVDWRIATSDRSERFERWTLDNSIGVGETLLSQGTEMTPAPSSVDSPA